MCVSNIKPSTRYSIDPAVVFAVRNCTPEALDATGEKNERR